MLPTVQGVAKRQIQLSGKQQNSLCDLDQGAQLLCVSVPSSVKMEMTVVPILQYWFLLQFCVNSILNEITQVQKGVWHNKCWQDILCYIFTFHWLSFSLNRLLVNEQQMVKK